MIKSVPIKWLIVVVEHFEIVYKASKWSVLGSVDKQFYMMNAWGKSMDVCYLQ